MAAEAGNSFSFAWLLCSYSRPPRLSSRRMSAVALSVTLSGFHFRECCERRHSRRDRRQSRPLSLRPLLLEFISVAVVNRLYDITEIVKFQFKFYVDRLFSDISVLAEPWTAEPCWVFWGIPSEDVNVIIYTPKGHIFLWKRHICLLELSICFQLDWQNRPKAKMAYIGPSSWNSYCLANILNFSNGRPLCLSAWAIKTDFWLQSDVIRIGSSSRHL